MIAARTIWFTKFRVGLTFFVAIVPQVGRTACRAPEFLRSTSGAAAQPTCTFYGPPDNERPHPFGPEFLNGWFALFSTIAAAVRPE
jgi:hypothetical protein